MTYLIIIIVIILIIDKIMNINNNKEIKINEIDKYEYIVKKSPMTYTEKQFYKQLKNVTDKYNLIIMPQVQTQAIFDVKYKQKNYMIAKNKIIAKSIDFAIVDTEYNYKLFIELDDNSHKKRIERDKFINELFNKYNLKLFRIKPTQKYDLTEIEEYIKRLLAS